MKIGREEMSTEQREQRLQLKAWVREAVGSGEDEAVLITELQCTEPGCAPLETVMAVLRVSGAEQRKLSLSLSEITRDHVLRAWRAPRRPVWFPNALTPTRPISEDELRRLLASGATIERW